MLKYAIYLLSLLCILGPISLNNKTLEPYKEEVLAIIQEHCNMFQYNNPIDQFLYFKRLNDGVVAQCLYSPFFYTIEVDPDYWKHMTEDERFQTMAHEMTHCTLLLQHVDNPYNYMYYRMVDISKKEVIKQLEKNLKDSCGR